MSEFIKLERTYHDTQAPSGPAYLRPAAVTAVVVGPDAAEIYAGNAMVKIDRKRWDERAAEILGQDP